MGNKTKGKKNNNSTSTKKSGQIIKIPAERRKFLVGFNLFMGGIHALQGILILVLSNDYAIDITTNFLTFNTENNSIINDFRSIGSLALGPIVALFLFLSSIAHFSVTLPQVKEWYISNLQKGINYARWLEYALSSSVMLVPIALLTGLTDLIGIILILSLNIIMNLCGMLMEIYNQNKRKVTWLPYYLGVFAGIMPWVALFAYFFAALNNSSESVPTFVYYIIFILFITFNSFAINMILQYKKVGPWKDYVFGEIIYIFLSLTAKSLLAWQVFGGTLR